MRRTRRERETKEERERVTKCVKKCVKTVRLSHVLAHREITCLKGKAAIYMTLGF